MDQATRRVYERVAEQWARKRGSATDERGRAFRDLVGDGLIADLGCGSGRFLDQLGAPTVGLDVSFAMLKQSTPRAVPLIQGDIEALPFADQSLSGIFARHSYLHVPKARMYDALREMGRVLALSGHLEMTLIGGSYEGHNLPSDDFPGRFFAFWERDEIARSLRDAGFCDIAVDTLDVGDGYFDLLVTARR